MALSQEEQRLLDELGAALEAEDPKLASTLRGTTPRKLHTRRAALAGLIFVVGVICLISGMKVHFALSVAGFVIMLVATVIAISSWRYVDESGTPAAPGPTPPSSESFMDKLNQRWEQRQRDGF